MTPQGPRPWVRCRGGLSLDGEGTSNFMSGDCSTGMNNEQVIHVCTCSEDRLDFFHWVEKKSRPEKIRTSRRMGWASSCKQRVEQIWFERSYTQYTFMSRSHTTSCMIIPSLPPQSSFLSPLPSRDGVDTLFLSLHLLIYPVTTHDNLLVWSAGFDPAVCAWSESLDNRIQNHHQSLRNPKCRSLRREWYK